MFQKMVFQKNEKIQKIQKFRKNKKIGIFEKKKKFFRFQFLFFENSILQNSIKRLLSLEKNSFKKIKI